MTAARCLRCNRVWSHGGGRIDRLVWISRFCPDCIALFPRVAG